ncbi:MAG: GNAT family N-acetyltransferase [Kofleriaceae bacterium]
MQIERRPARRDEREYLEEVHVAALGPLALVGYGWPALKVREHFHTSIALANCHVIVVDDRRAGYVSVEDRGAFWYIGAIAIAPKFQRHGIGTAVLRDLLLEAGHTPVRLNVLHVNRARALYERLGFKAIARDDQRQIMEWRSVPR